MATSIGRITFRKKGKTCFDHKGRKLDFYCQQCETLLCVRCLLTIHKGHDVYELSETTPKTKQDITTFINRMEQSDLVQIRGYITSTDTLLKNNTSNFEKLSHKLKTQTDKLKQDIDMLTAQSLSLYLKMEKDNAKLIQTYTQDLEKYDKQLTQQIQKCKEALESGSHIEIYDAGCEIHSQISLPVKPVLNNASFIPNKNPQHQLVKALGKRFASAPNRKLLPLTKVVEKWRSPCEINTICPTTDDQAWTKYNDTLTLMDMEGKVIHQVKHKAKITGISVSPTTHTLWVCDGENNILELVSRRLTHRFSTMEKPKCICITASNHVIVGMAKHISKFTTQGQMVLTTMAAGTGKPLVCSPYRISECPVTHNIAVVDWNDIVNGGDGKSYVVVMDTDFKKQFVYDDEILSTFKQASHTGTKLFDPYCVMYDSVGNILIGDWENKRVLFISGCGEFLKIIHTDSYFTCAVGVDRNDVLWAVFGWSHVKVLHYSTL